MRQAFSQFLGIAFGVAGDIPKSREYGSKAFGLIDRVSEYERDQIAAAYYGLEDKCPADHNEVITNEAAWFLTACTSWALAYCGAGAR